MKKRVGVLLVNFNQWDLTRNCLDTLMASEGVEIVPALVDNNSSGPVPGWVYDMPGLLFHRSPVNSGFATANNTAFGLLDENDTDYTFILNNDTEVFPDTVRLLTDHMDSNPDVGIVTPAIFFAENPDRIWSAGGRLIPWRMMVQQEYRSALDLPSSPVACSFATGCAILMRTSGFREVGMFDTGLFIYSDDIDLCLRVTGTGRGIRLIPASRILHHVSVTVGGVFSPMAIYFTHRNRCIVARRYLSLPVRMLFYCYYLAITVLKTAVFTFRGWSHLVPWMWRATAHGLAGRTGIVPEGLIGGTKETHG